MRTDSTVNTIERQYESFLKSRGQENFRPTVIAVVARLATPPEILLVAAPGARRREGLNALKSVQGGIKHGETVLQAGLRELNEEIGLPKAVISAAYGLETRRSELKERGHRSGDPIPLMRYYPLLFLINSLPELRLRRQKVESAALYPLSEVKDIFARHPRRRKEISEPVLESLIKVLAKVDGR